MPTTVPVWVWINRGLQHVHILRGCRAYLLKQDSNISIAQVIVVLERTEELSLVIAKNSADFESLLVTAKYKHYTSVYLCVL